MSDSNNSSSGMGCLSFLAVGLTILFVGLKLTGHIGWSWLWVISPLWIYASLGMSLFILVFGSWVILELIKSSKAKKLRKQNMARLQAKRISEETFRLNKAKKVSNVSKWI